MTSVEIVDPSTTAEDDEQLSIGFLYSRAYYRYNFEWIGLEVGVGKGDRMTEERGLATSSRSGGYEDLRDGIARLIDEARSATARSVNTVLTTTYWMIGRHVVEFEQKGQQRAIYGEQLLDRLASDLSMRFGKGFSATNLRQSRLFFIAFPCAEIQQTSSDEFARRFRLPWSAYVRLLTVKDPAARRFYEEEALRGGWTVRQLDRQIDSLFYERTALSRDKAAVLKKAARKRGEDYVTPEEAIKDPYVLEFLGLKDEYSETSLEEALILHLEHFLLELGGDFAFLGRQERLRVGDQWYRVDLLFFHRRLRCLVIIDLKTGRFTHADAGQMHLYLNYAAENWTIPGENPPVGLILCAQKDDAVVRYALENLPNPVLAAEYRLVLPDEAVIAKEIEKTRKVLASRAGRQERAHPATQGVVSNDDET